MPDLLAATHELVAIPSVSFHEAAVTDHIEARLRACPWLEVHRVEHNLVARTSLGRDRRLILAGHTDTVPPTDGHPVRLDDDVLHGVGAADMKSGLAVMLALAEGVPDPAIDVTFVFYAAEEVAAEHNGLGMLFDRVPHLLRGDVALLGEPTAGQLEAGCQGTLRLRVNLRGARAHTARPWTGRNAVHRAGHLLALVDAAEQRRPVVGGCAFRESLQAVQVLGGSGANVVPDEAVVVLNHRFAPDRSGAEAEAYVRGLLAPVLDDGDAVDLVDMAEGSAPSLDHPLVAALVERNGLQVTAKLGWTDVARFAAHGIPAANFGPGDARLAHTAGEFVDRAPIDRCHAALLDLLRRGPD